MVDSPSSLSRARARALRLLIVGMLAIGLAGCAGLPSLSLPDLDLGLSGPPEPIGERVLAPRGPGAVFASVDAAAIDALSYSFLASRSRLASVRESRAGAIHRVEGGFSYDEPTRASDGALGRLRYRLRPDDVAHFRHDPQAAAVRPPGTIRGISARDRRLVDRRDPLHRPLYVLTPKRFLRVYPGGEVGTQTLARVTYGARAGDTELELVAYTGLPGADETPLAHQPPAP